MLLLLVLSETGLLRWLLRGETLVLDLLMLADPGPVAARIWREVSRIDLEVRPGNMNMFQRKLFKE